MKLVNPQKSGCPNESLCDVIKLGVPFKRNLEFLWRKLNLIEHKDEEDVTLMKKKVPKSI